MACLDAFQFSCGGCLFSYFLSSYYLNHVTYEGMIYSNPGHYLFRYRRKREKLVEKIAVSRLPTKWGLFQAYCYRSNLDGTEHIAVVKV